MNPRIVLVTSLVLAPLAIAQTGCETGAQFCAYMAKAAIDFTVSKLGQASGQSTSTSSDCKGSAGSADPALQTQGIAPPADICDTPYDGPDACVACIRAHCCAELVACTGDYTCICTIARKEGRSDWPEEAECDEANDITRDAIACQADHCAEACSAAAGG